MLASVRFYRDTLGFEMVTTSKPYASDGRFHWGLLRLNGVELMLNTAYDEGDEPERPDPARVAAHGDTMLFFGCPDVDAAYEHLVQKGIKVWPPTVAWYGMKQLNLTDPDGYGICFQWPSS